MKKKIFVILSLALACLLVLSGCACQHEWKEADCLNAKVCTKCEEVEGEPLGHDWREATCAAPETCSRCGETQGEMLEHTYGKWVIGETDMTRTCEGCGKEESAEIDREVALLQDLEGHWDFYAEGNGSQVVTVNQARNDYVGIWFSYADDGTAQFFNTDQVYEGTVEFYKFVPASDEAPLDQYYFYFCTEDGAKIAFCRFAGENPVMAMYPNNTDTFLLTQEPIIEEGMTALWTSTDGTEIYTIDLKEDRTFTANLGEKISGTWHLRSSYTSYGYQYAGLSLRYEKDGKIVADTYQISLGSENSDLADQMDYFSFYARIDNESISFKKMNRDELKTLEETLQVAPTSLVGQWTSTSVSSYSQSAGGSTTTPRTDLTIDFKEDGTFTANLDTERKGTWEYNTVNINGSSFDCSYYLHFDGVSNKVYASISGHNRELHFSNSGNGESKTIYFSQMTDEEKAQMEAETEKAKTRIIGDWTSISIYEDSNNISSTDYTISFNADGTFTTNLEEGTSGTWTFGEVEIEREYNATHYRYNITMDGYAGHVSAYIFNNEELSLSLYENSQGRNIDFAQLTAEDLEQMAKADEMIIGTWSGEEFTQYNEEAQKMEVVRKEGHTLTVNEDGSFTSTLPDMAEGTWSFWKIDEYGYASYSFRAGDTGMIYRILDDGSLEIFLSDGDKAIFMDMTRK